MLQVKGRLLAAAVAGVLVIGGAARGEQADSAELARQVRELQTQVEQLKAAQTQQAAQNAQAVDDTVRRILADADQRSQLLAIEGFTAGYNKGKFVIQDAAGDFVLNPNAQFQFRYVANSRDGDDNDTSDGFEVRRLKFSLDGNLFTPKLTYKFQWATNRKESTSTRTDGDVSVTDVTSPAGGLILEDAWVKYEFADGWAVRLGQFKDPAFHEEIVSSKRQLAVDRSLMNELLAGGVTDYVQGVGLMYSSENFRVETAFIDGHNSDNTHFVDAGTNWGASIRGEYKLLGNWKQYDDFTAMGNKEDLLVIGGGATMSQSGDTDVVIYTLDAQWEPQAVSGLSLYGAVVGREQSNGASLSDWGLLAQAGYMLNDKWEIFGRYDLSRLDADRFGDGVENELHEITAGVNYYFRGHAAKFTVDVTWLPSGSPVSVDGIGILGQSTDDDQFVLRAQFQLLL